MAIISTTASLVRQYNAFTGLSALERSQSGIARAEIIYYNVNDTWPGPGSGNTRTYSTGNIDLPKDFGYVLTDAFCRLDRGGSSEVGATSILRIYPGGILGPQLNMTLTSPSDRQNASGNTPIGDIPANLYNSIYQGSEQPLVYQLDNKPTAVLYPFSSASYTTDPNPATVWNWTIGEQFVNGSDYDMTLYFRFLQYDIDQSYNYVIQSPQVTR